MRTTQTTLYKQLIRGKNKAFAKRMAKELAAVRKMCRERGWFNPDPEYQEIYEKVGIQGAFFWSDTPQGHGFWCHVSEHGEFPA